MQLFKFSDSIIPILHIDDKELINLLYGVNSWEDSLNYIKKYKKTDVCVMRSELSTTDIRAHKFWTREESKFGKSTCFSLLTPDFSQNRRKSPLRENL